MSAATIALIATAWVAASVAAAGALCLAYRLRNERDEARCEATDAQAAVARLESDLSLSRLCALAAADLASEITRTAHRAFAERDEWRRKHEDATDETAWMRMRGRILPDIDDRAERMVFDDGGESPIFDGMPVGLLAEYAVVAG